MFEETICINGRDDEENGRKMHCEASLYPKRRDAPVVGVVYKPLTAVHRVLPAQSARRIHLEICSSSH